MTTHVPPQPFKALRACFVVLGGGVSDHAYMKSIGIPHVLICKLKMEIK